METQRTQFSFLSPNTSDKGPPIRRHIGVLGSAAAVAVGGGAGLLAVSAGVASAASFTVTNCNDSGAGSLRQAVLDSEAASGADTISISAVCDASGAVSVSGVMKITDSLAIVGPGAASFILDGQGSTQIFNVAGTGVEDVVLSGMTITNGKIVGNRGGAIEFDRLDSLSIDDVAFRGNESTSTGGAAVVHWINEVSISNSTFEGNVAAADGGALYLIYNTDVVISNSTFEGNVSGGNGGAVTVYEQPGTFDLFNSTLTGNDAAGDGGGLAFTGLYSSGTIGFSTITDNVAGGYGGGIMSTDESSSGETVSIFGTIVAGNIDKNGNNEVDLQGQIPTTSFNNLFEGGTAGFQTSTSDLLGVDPLLEPLADNGGLTTTQLLGFGSPAIDAGPASFTAFVGSGFDQRGAPCLRVVDGTPDIGAIESGQVCGIPSSTTTTSTSSGDQIVPVFTG